MGNIYPGAGTASAVPVAGITGRSRGSAAPVAAGGTAFVIPHGLAGTPTFASVTPKNALSAAVYFVTVDATNLTVNYLIAPSAGTLGYFWSAEL